MALFSVAVGVYDLWSKNSLFEFDIENESLKWLAIVWALHEAMPGMVFAGCVSHLCRAMTGQILVAGTSLRFLDAPVFVCGLQ